MTTVFEREAAGLVVEQSIDDVLDYGRDWSDLVPDGDVIVSSVWQAAGATLTSPGQSGLVTNVFVALDVGTREAVVSNVVQTAAGRRQRWDFVVRRRVSPVPRY